MNRQLLIATLCLMGWSVGWGQCTECIPDPACTSVDGFPTICPELLPDGVAGEPYETVITFYLPVSVEDPGSGITATLNSVTITGIQGLPQGLEVTLSDPDGVYEPPSGQTMGCATVCGTPIWPGNFVITIQISALATAFGIEQEVNDSFSFDLHIEGGAGGAGTFVADTTSGCGSLVAAFESTVTADAPQLIAWAWDFGNADAAVSGGAATAAWDAAGSYIVGLTTTVSDLVLTSLNVTSGASNGGWNDFFSAPDLFFTVSSAAGPVFTSNVVSDASTPSWLGLSIPLTDPPYTVSFYDDDSPLFSNDAMGSFTLNPSVPGSGNFSAAPTFGQYTIGLQTAFQIVDSMTVFVLPEPDPEMPIVSAEGLFIPNDSLGWEVIWWTEDSAVGSGNPWFPPANGPYLAEVANAQGCAVWTDTVMWCAPNANVSVVVQDSLLLPDPGFVTYAWTGPNGALPLDSLGLPWLASASGWYELVVTDVWGCTAVATPALVCLNWGIPFIDQNPNGDLFTTPDFATYSWWLDGAPLAGADSSWLPNPNPGAYVVEVSDFADCPAVMSPEWTVVSVDEALVPEGWTLAASPFASTFQVRGSGATWTVAAFDAMGRMVESRTGHGEEMLEMLGTAQSGVYHLKLGEAGVVRVVKQGFTN